MEETTPSTVEAVVEYVPPAAPSDAAVDQFMVEAAALMRDRGLGHEFFADFRQLAESLKGRLAALGK